MCVVLAVGTEYRLLMLKLFIEIFIAFARLFNSLFSTSAAEMKPMNGYLLMLMVAWMVLL